MAEITERAERTALERMLEARSVAVVGASARQGSFGERMLLELTEGGFDGGIFPVNPKYEEVLGLRTYQTVAEIGEPVDLVLLGVPNALLEEQLKLAADAGAASAVIFASGYEEPREGVPPLTQRLARIARDRGMALCGGNCMGFLNIERRLRACGFYEPKGLEPGGVAFISHSGSAFSALLHNDRGMRFNVVVSTGQEFVTPAADYMRYAVELDSTSVVGLFIEAVREPARFREALELAAEGDIPVVCLKVGREALTREMVAAHSGALAGEDGAYEALFDAHGVLRVETLDEMVDTLALLANGRRAGPGGLATVHDSGGERAMLIDVAAREEVRFAAISDETTVRLAAALEPGLPAVNPLDAWGTGNASHEIYVECLRALLADHDTAALAFVVDLTTEDNPQMGYIGMARAAFSETEKPFAMLSNLASAVDRNDVHQLEEAGIPVLEGTATGLAAFRHLFEYRDFRLRPPVAAPEPVTVEVREKWRARLGGGEEVSELEGLALLADYGVPVVDARSASTLEDALEAADHLGWPVALKTAAPGVRHKSDIGGVRLGLTGADELADAYRDLEHRLGPEVTVARMAPSGVELALGIVRDPQFGPLILVAAGGLLVELLRDRRLAFPPLDDTRASGLIDRLKVRPLLEGVRGTKSADIAAVARAVSRVSLLAQDLGDLLEALDANPLIATPEGCFAVDSLVIGRR